MRLTKLILAGLMAIFWPLSGHVYAAAFSVAGGLSDYAAIVEVDCNFEFRPGREFQFPSAESNAMARMKSFTLCQRSIIT